MRENLVNKLQGFKLTPPNHINYDKFKVDYGLTFEHLARDCPELVEYPKGKMVPLGLCFSLWIQIELRMPELDFATSYTLSDICGIDYWLRLSELLRYVANDCVMWLIEEEGIALPLILVLKNDEDIQMYRLK